MKEPTTVEPSERSAINRRLLGIVAPLADREKVLVVGPYRDRGHVMDNGARADEPGTSVRDYKVIRSVVHYEWPVMVCDTAVWIKGLREPMREWEPLK